MGIADATAPVSRTAMLRRHKELQMSICGDADGI